MIPPRVSPVVFCLILSGPMSGVVSGMATYRTAGRVPGSPNTWFATWLSCRTVAFPAALVTAPLARRPVARPG